jgi:trehalose 6-phosphate phosphatase
MPYTDLLEAAMTKPLETLDLGLLGPGEVALLIDFDGTLVDFAERPDDVSLAPETQAVLETLSRQLHGALAIVSGRPIEDIDRFFAPALLPVAGVHGLTRRTAKGDVITKSIDEHALAVLTSRLQPFAEGTPGVLLETKPGSVVLHYRARPESEGACISAVHKAVADLEGVQLLHGKMVIEAKAGMATKAEAVAEFMAEQPFRGRRPIFAGDDVTDEHAFEEIAKLGGFSIKIGAGETSALYRTQGVGSFQAWLLRLAAELNVLQPEGIRNSEQP